MYSTADRGQLFGEFMGNARSAGADLEKLGAYGTRAGRPARYASTMQHAQHMH
jgi:hypothetical protein